jgi:ubiquinone/menaquinone biosynthesis C-methylase UbiE
MMSQPHLAKRRSQLLASADGEILEIGVGTGLNLPHYPAHVRKIAAVDPNPGMGKLLRRRVAETGMNVDHRAVGGEELPFQDATFDCVVSTWTLCSVQDAGRAVAELYRVLKPSGRFLFLEHGLSDMPKVRTWQRRLNWLQMLLAGCRLDLNVRELLACQPFSSVRIDNFYLEKTPKTHGYMYQGVATK